MNYTELFRKGETNTKETIERENENKVECKTERLFKALEKLKIQRKKENFARWLKTDITDMVNYDNSYEEDQHYLVRHMIEDLVHQVTKKLNDHGYTINQTKEFRDEIASFIYKLSN